MQAESYQGVSRVVLTGYMGSGKTTVGQLLANRLGWTFADLDQVIAAGEAMTVPQIFAEQGESAFREMEGRYLAELLQKTCTVIALGGGAPETEALRTTLKGSRETAVVFLAGAFETLYARCASQGTDPDAVARPLLGTREASQTRFNRRQPAYAAIATHTVAADSGEAGDVAETVIRLLGLLPRPATTPNLNS